MTESYSVRLPTGWEGPYTVEELREFLATGKVRSSDRIRRADGSTTSVSAVLPDAIDISIVRPPASERIVRKSSDRHAAVARKEASNRLKAVGAAPEASASPNPTPRNAPVASNRSSASDRQPTTDRKRTSDRQAAASDRRRTSDRQAAVQEVRSGRGRMAVGIIATLVIVASIGWQVASLIDWSEHPTNILGTWKADEQVAVPAMKGLVLRIGAGTIEFDGPAGKRSSKFEVIGDNEGGEQSLRLTPADPDFGESIHIQPGTDRLMLGTAQGSGILLIVHDK